MRHVLVTGGAGFVGSHVVDELLSAGYNVTVLNNLAEAVHDGPPAYINKEAEYVWGDVRDRELLRDLLSRVDAVSHQASAVGIGRSMDEMEEFVDANARATAVLFDILASTETSVEAVVVASSMSIYGEGQYRCDDCGLRQGPTQRSDPSGQDSEWDPKCQDCDAILKPVPTPETAEPDPQSVYATTKFSQERLGLLAGRTHGITVTPLRYFIVYGGRQSLDNPYTGVCATFLNRIANGKPIVVFEDGAQTGDFVHISDVARANRAALERRNIDGAVVDIGTGETMSILEIAETLIDVCDADVPIDVTNQYRQGDIRHCIADPSRASRLLSFEPTISCEEGIRELVEWGRGRETNECFDRAVLELKRHDVLQGAQMRNDERPIVSGIGRPTGFLVDRAAIRRGAR